MNLNYGMFSDAGNGMIHGIVVAARYKNLTWPQVREMLCTISEIEGYGEATDTDVRERVYDILGFESSFYC